MLQLHFTTRLNAASAVSFRAKASNLPVLRGTLVSRELQPKEYSSKNRSFFSETSRTNRRIVAMSSANTVGDLTTSQSKWPGLPDNLVSSLEALPPPLLSSKHKGQAGRIGVVGGCTEYTGAPYFAAMTALRVGADLVHVFCTQGAGPVIKSYSPELIVHPYLSESGDQPRVSSGSDEVYAVSEWLPRLHALVVGPGLGRDQAMLAQTREIIRGARDAEKVIIIDADGLFLINSNLNLIQGYHKCVLTPNKMEFARLIRSLQSRPTFQLSDDDIKELDEKTVLEAVCRELGGVTVVKKGAQDLVHNGQFSLQALREGSSRRAGGQGDVLAGTIAVFVSWAVEAYQTERIQVDDSMPIVMGCYAACETVRTACRNTFESRRRSMVAGDVIEHIGDVMEDTFPVGEQSKL